MFRFGNLENSPKILSSAPVLATVFVLMTKSTRSPIPSNLPVLVPCFLCKE